jgi:mannonate dehydratase
MGMAFIYTEDSMHPHRRSFVASLLAGAGGRPARAVLPGNKWSAAGMRLGVSHQAPAMLTEQHLRYLKQMGVEYLEVRIPGAQASYERLAAIKRMVEDAGLRLFEIMLADKYSSPEFSLGLPGRDREIASFQGFLRDLGKAGIDTTTYAWYTGGTYQTGTTTTRGCETRLFQLGEARKKPPAAEREYSDEEMWANYEYFIRRVLPVAEDSGVRLQLHPNDPPVTHQGVARIFRSLEAFRRAMEIANHSPYSGLLFCVGSWAEMAGRDGRGEDVIGGIREFGSRGHIYQVHFRNISSNLPDFHETFPDNGYLNMYRVMKALGETGFNGMIVPDHVPGCAASEAGPKAAEAFIFGYIRAMIQAVNTELGRAA